MRRTIQEVRDEIEQRRAAYEKTKKRQRQRLLGTVPLAIAAVVCAALLVPWTDMSVPPDAPASPPAHPDVPQSGQPTTPVDPMDPQEPPKGGNPSWPLNIYMGGACYSDGVDSFDELLEQAELIIMGTVVDALESSPATETATVRVDTIYRGEKSLTDIQLYQLKGSHTVKVGRTYLLFLNKQGGDVENAFYSIGGYQGTIAYDAVRGGVSVNDACIDEEDVLAWLKKAAVIAPTD